MNGKIVNLSRDSEIYVEQFEKDGEHFAKIVNSSNAPTKIKEAVVYEKIYLNLDFQKKQWFTVRDIRNLLPLM